MSSLVTRSPYKECDLYEAVNFVYHNAERQEYGQRAVELVSSSAIIRDIHRWLSVELRDGLLFLLQYVKCACREDSENFRWGGDVGG